MTLAKIKNEWYTESISTFVNDFNGALEWFERKYGKSEDWDFGLSDGEIISEFFEEKKEEYLVIYNEQADGFDIYQLED